MTRIRESDEINRLGMKHVREVIEQGWGGVIQEIQGSNDRGFDATFFDFHAGQATSLRFDLQIKSSKTRFQADRFIAPIDQRHRELYLRSEVPVVLVCVDENPPVTAFWRLIRPGESSARIYVSRKRLFGPASRGDVIAAIRHVFPKQMPPAIGEVLEFPLEQPIRDAAKDYYRRKLIGRPHNSPTFGPVEFTWKGWRHLTRRSRSKWRIRSSLMLLPCIRAVLTGPILPTHSRQLEPVSRGSRVQTRTLLTFERSVIFPRRAPACVRVVIESQSTLPVDWALSLPSDPRRELVYKFLSLSEVKPPS